ncbi:hypothetical protein ACL9RL_17620 [Plantibacter sp. Mn2098]|uniref:hypothetical protein n=1 Tax=Plantibacter sp. Mn2098 TaxID=3395266 RepID=UPI003BD16E2A
MLVAVLSLSAVLAWVLVMHSGAQMSAMPAGSHGIHTVTDAADTPGAATTITTTTTIATATAMSMTLQTAPGDVPCGAGCTPDCAMMTALCALLVTLLALVHLAVAPAVHRPLVEALRQVMLFCAEAGIPVHRPDLNALSISRT